MATFNESKGGIIVAPPPEPKVKRKPRKIEFATCRCCGFETKKSRRIVALADAVDGMCLGCSKFFGVFERGCTDMSYESTLERLNEIEEAKHVLCFNSQSFGVPETGDSIGTDFGDIFHVHRIGGGKNLRPTGDCKYAMKAFTVGIIVNGHPLTLFMHEVMPIHWVRVMELKKSGSYEEAYLTTEDNSGYWKPSDEMKSEMTNMYGDR